MEALAATEHPAAPVARNRLYSLDLWRRRVLRNRAERMVEVLTAAGYAVVPR